MEWTDLINIIIGVIVAVSAGIGIPLALRSRSKKGPQKLDELNRHLLEIGEDVYIPHDATYEKTIGEKRFSLEKSQGVIGLKNRKIDWMNLIGVSTQYGTEYYIDYLLRSPNLDIIKIKNTSLKKKKRLFKDKDNHNLYWSGDESISKSLNLDYRIFDKIGQSEYNGNIQIIPEKKHGYIRIRTAYFLPEPEFIGAIEIIASHINI